MSELVASVVIITYAFRIKVNGQVLIKNKIGTKCITPSIGNHTAPNNIPNNCSFVEYISPTVTKYAEKTNSKNENGSFPPPAYFQNIFVDD